MVRGPPPEGFDRPHYRMRDGGSVFSISRLRCFLTVRAWILSGRVGKRKPRGHGLSRFFSSPFAKARIWGADRDILGIVLAPPPNRCSSLA